ncbi:MAG: hypothetical protein ABEJ96_00630 [Thiohalorhabdaceae bacterium]
MRMKTVFGAGCAFAMMGSTAFAAEDLGDAEGFQARSVTYVEGEEPQNTIRVYMGPGGRRMEGVPPQGVTLVAPAEEDKRWFVDEESQRYAVDNSVSKGGTLGGVLSHKPCKGFNHSEKVGDADLNGRDVVKWKCRHPDYGEVTQWFDPEINTVIRDRTDQGKIQELREIQVGPQNPEQFSFEPSEEFEKVPVMELFQG